MAERRFQDRVVLVTGGGSGIGRAAALAFAREGAAVAIAGRGAERGEAVLAEIRSLGGQGAFFAADVSRGGEVEALVRGVAERFGRLDCAFNNAGTLEVGSFKTITAISEEEFDQALALNLKSVWLCMRHEIAQMLEQGTGGAIVNTSSLNGLGGLGQGSLYATAKAGVLALTKSAAQEFAQQGVRVNALVPGTFRTPMLEGIIAQLSGGDPAAVEAVEAQYAGMVPLGRIGRPEEAAEAVLWLCSEAASYVTGHSMIVDGGFSSSLR